MRDAPENREPHDACFGGPQRRPVPPDEKAVPNQTKTASFLEAAPDPPKTDSQAAAVIPDPEVSRARELAPVAPHRPRRRSPGHRRAELLHARHRVASATGRQAADDADVAGHEQGAAGRA